MKRYNMTLVVRPKDGPCETGDQQRCCNITANSEPEARKAALEQAWQNGLLVRRAVTTKIREA